MRMTLHGCEWQDKSKGVVFISDIEMDLPINSVRFMQRMVRGKIAVYNHNGRDLVVNDKGILLGLPLNPWGAEQGLQLFGTIIEIHGKLP